MAHIELATALKQELKNELNTYKLMYKFGAWITKETIAAESDKEAIFDADMTFAASRLQSWENGVALFCGVRIVKRYI